MRSGCRSVAIGVLGWAGFEGRGCIETTAEIGSSIVKAVKFPSVDLTLGLTIAGGLEGLLGPA
jgi:hypothetical protein